MQDTSKDGDRYMICGVLTISI